MKQFIKFLVRKVPREYLIFFSFLFSKLITPFYYGNKYECPICGGKFRKFLPYGNQGEDNRLCPKCLSLERHRLLWLYLKNKTDFFTSYYKVLHIAPEQTFYYRFKKMDNIEYITADLKSPLAKVKMDITKMPFEDNSFDIIICNHVLEHIDNDEIALSEIYRVLNDKGWAILQVPIDKSRNVTFEDKSIIDPTLREKLFGQHDHVRIYGLDYSNRLKNAGFFVLVDDYINTIDKTIIARYRLPYDESIYVVYKNNNT